MIIKGKARGNGAQLAAYLFANKHDQAELLLLRGTMAPDLSGALMELDDRRHLTESHLSLYHAEINWRIDETLSHADQLAAAQVLEDQLGFSGQPVAVVRHVYQGREHLHLVWSLVDVPNERALRYDHNYRKHELAARELERRFGHERVQGAHAERDGRPRPERTPEQYEYQQAQRLEGPEAAAFRQMVREAYAQSDNGASFKMAIEQEGCILAQGDRRNAFVIVNEQGGILALKTSTVNARAADIRLKLADIDRAQLLSVDAARAQQRERQQDQQLEQTGRQETGSNGAGRLRPNKHTKRSITKLLRELSAEQQGQTPASAPPPEVPTVADEKHWMDKAEERFSGAVGAIFDLTMGRGADGVPGSSAEQYPSQGNKITLNVENMNVGQVNQPDQAPAVEQAAAHEAAAAPANAAAHEAAAEQQQTAEQHRAQQQASEEKYYADRNAELAAYYESIEREREQELERDRER